VKAQRRSKIVTFRLSETEFDSLKSACGANRNSVSAVARGAVLEWADGLAIRPKMDDRLAEIHNKLDRLFDLLNRDRDEHAELS
jgi:hypothetical protein